MSFSARLEKAAYRRAISALAGAGLALFAPLAQASTFHKADNTDALNSATSYTENSTVPTNADTIVFDNTIAGSLSFGSGNGNPILGDFQVLNPGGPLTLAINNTSGSTPGTLTVGSPTGGDTVIDLSAATQDFTITGGTLRFGAVTTTRTFNVAAGRTLAVNSGITSVGNTQTLALVGAGTILLNGPISGVGPISLAIGGAAVTLGSANTFTGATTLTTGVLTLGNTNALLNSTLTDNNAAANAVTFTSGLGTVNAGALAGTGSFALTDAGGAAVALSAGASNATTTFSGALSGLGSLLKTGTGTLTVSSNAMTYSGGTTVSGGTLLLNFGTNTNTSAQIGTGALTLSNGGTLRENGGAGANLNNALAIGPGGGTVSFRKTSTFQPASITGTDALTLQIDNGVTLSTTSFQGYAGTVNLTNGGTGAALRLGTGSSTLFDSNSLANAALNLGAGVSVNRYNGTNGTTTTNIGTLSGAAGSFIGGSAAGGGTFVLSVGARNENSTFAGAIINGGTKTALTKVGTGTLTLTGANSQSGVTTITGGTLNINGVNALGGGNYTGTTFNGGTLQYSSGLATANNGSSDISNIGGTPEPVTIAAGGATVDTNGSNVTYANTIGNNGAGSLTKTGAGVLTLQATNTYAGGTTISGGAISGPTAAYSTGNVTVNAGGTADYTQNAASTYTASITGNGSVTVGANPGGALTGGGTITYAGVDSAANTTVSNGTLLLNHAGGAAATGPVAAATGGTVALGADNEIAPSSSVTLLGGTLAANGHNEGTAGTPGLGTLQVGDPAGSATTSTLDFGDAGGTNANTLSFADSSTLTWNGTVTLTGYTDGTDALYIGKTNDLTTTQLSDITFNGRMAMQDATGRITFAAAPEPSGWASMIIGMGVLGGVLARKRRQAA